MLAGSDILLPVGLAFVLSAIGVRLVAAISQRLNFVDQYNPNTQNAGGAALGGGVPVAVVTVVITWLMLAPVHASLPILAPVLGLCALGLADDKRSFHPGAKVLGQCGCIAIYLIWRDASVATWLVAGPFLLVAANAWNVVDVMDGLAGFIGVLSLIAGGVVLFLSGQPLAPIAFVAAAALTGFLVWNRPPALVLLGDAGSLSLGFLFGLLVVEAWTAAPRVGMTVGIAGLIPFFEVLFLVIERWRRGIPFYRVTPDHFALRLKRHGWPVKRILKWVGGIGASLGMLAIVIAILEFHRLSLVAVALCVVVVSATMYRQLLRFAPEDAPPSYSSASARQTVP